jgi:hypothetical protein
MKAFNLENPVETERIIRAVADEMKAYARETGGLRDAILCIQVRQCMEDQKDNGTAPRREMRSR